MKKIIVGTLFFASPFAHGMESRDAKIIKKEFFDLNKKVSEATNPETKDLQKLLVLGAEYFTSGKSNKEVRLTKFAKFHGKVRPACQKLIAQRDDSTPKPDLSNLNKQFNSTVALCQTGDKDSAQQVINIGAELLMLGQDFDSIHPKIKEAGYLLRNKKDPAFKK